MSFLKKAFSKVNAAILAVLGLDGITGYTFLFNGIAQAGSTVDGVVLFYSNIVSAMSGVVDGMGIFLSESFNLVADTIVPGLGTAISILAHAL